MDVGVELLVGHRAGSAGYPQDQQQWLLGQVRLGEAMYREDLVRDSLARLESIAPEHPQVLVGGIRQALLQHNQPLVEQRLEQLRRQARVRRRCTRPRP